MKQVLKQKMRISNFLYNILDFIYKKSCLICHSKKENSFLCSKCKNSIEFMDYKPVKEILGIKVYSSCNYSDTPQKLVRLLKFHNKKMLAKDIAELSFNYLSSLGIDFSDFEIISVPLHKNKQRKRGYNQCELISEELSKLLNIPFNFDLIKRIKNTKPMYKLKKIQRMENLKDAFLIDKKYFSNKKLLVIDDITTTGSTFEEIIKELQKNDINEIICFSFTNTKNNSIFIK